MGQRREADAVNEAFITPDVAKWARERSGVSHAQLAASLGIDPDELVAWEKGGASPPFGKAQEMARILRIPFGYLFLSTPPTEQPAIPDLRTVGEDQRGRLSPDFIEVLNDALIKQEWYREHLEQHKTKKLAFVGRFRPADGVLRVAADLSEVISIPELRNAAHSWDEFLRLLTRSTEAVGVMVMRSGIVGANTHRTLSVNEFRGFAISDDIAPMVFINGQDSRAAQIFTLAHELAHIWIDQSGISNPDEIRIPTEHKSQIERFCNGVSAEVLVPRHEFLQHATATLTEQTTQKLAAHFRVSNVVILRRAYELDVITKSEFFRLIAEEKRRQEERQLREQVEEERGGGNFYATLVVRNSAILTTAVVSAFKEGTLSHSDTARLLNVKTGTLPKLTEGLFR